MKIGNGTELPAIHVYYSSPAIEPASYEQLLLGMEEEGVPYLRQAREEGSALHLGYLAAEQSRLGVGIGIGADGSIVLHYIKLKPDHPLFQIYLRETLKLRAIGANAARLVKGVPFKELESEMTSDIDIDIDWIIAEVVRRLKGMERLKGR